VTPVAAGPQQATRVAGEKADRAQETTFLAEKPWAILLSPLHKIAAFVIFLYICKGEFSQ
jgi:hypothetical protein